jgi:hypothetical protein
VHEGRILTVKFANPGTHTQQKTNVKGRRWLYKNPLIATALTQRAVHGNRNQTEKSQGRTFEWNVTCTYDRSPRQLTAGNDKNSFRARRIEEEILKGLKTQFQRDLGHWSKLKHKLQLFE